MAYFVKKSNTKKGLYLQIYFSYRDPQTKSPKNKSYCSIGYAQDLIDSGISDPIAYCQQKVDLLNREFHEQKSQNKVQKIGDTSPVRYLGHFAAAAIMRKLDIQEDIDLFSSSRNFQFSSFDCLSFLTYARLLCPSSKRQTCASILPHIYNCPSFSYDQILSYLDFIGSNYDKFVEIFTKHVDETYILDYSKAYFDCTNFYFEIDREDDWRRKGPSKENRNDPILGLGLLLDQNCIPVAMKLYPGNQSEKPILRDTINQLRRQAHVSGKIVQVADKGLNCTKNIHQALSNGDGYIFSKSVKTLNKMEQDWALNDKGFYSVKDQENNEKYKIKSCVDVYTYTYKDENERKHTFKVKEKRIVTYNPSLARKQRAEIKKLEDKANGCVLSQSKKAEYGESAKYVKFYSANKKTGELSEDSAILASINEEKIKKDLDCAGYNMIITSEIQMEDQEIYRTYHQLWRIEESFKTMKSQLDARPVYLQNIDRIKGHFLICYLSVLLERIIQFKVLDDQFGSEQVYRFMREFKICPLHSKEYMNQATSSEVFDYIEKKYGLPVANLYLKKSDITKILERAL